MNLEIKLSKCQFFQATFTPFRTFNLRDGINPLLDKILTITKLAVPKNINELCHFLGLMGYYRKFVLLFADILEPLNKLLQKESKFQWSTQCQTAFDHLKNALSKKPILKYPNINKPFTLQMQITMLFLAFSLKQLMT